MSPAPTPAPGWTPPATLPYAFFDCLQVNLAVLADRWHGAGTHLLLGAELRFTPVPGPDGLPTVELPLGQQLAEARRLGLLPREQPYGTTAAGVRPAEGRYVVADAYHLPWVPYHGQRHMEHSFLAEPAEPAGRDGAVAVLDGYHNETPWGRARPGRWDLDDGDFRAALPGTVTTVLLAPDPAGPAPAVAGAVLGPPDAVDSYTAAYARHPDRVAALRRLTLETWLLARSRKLHAAFLARHGDVADPAAVAEHLRGWDALAEQVYLASRRVERGRPEPAALLGRLAGHLHADRAVLGGAAGTAAAPGGDAEDGPAGPDGLRHTVATVAAQVLGTDPEPLLDGKPLDDVPTFSSFRVAELVERLESELGIEFDPDDLLPENLHRVSDICRIARRAPSRAGRADHSSGEAR